MGADNMVMDHRVGMPAKVAAVLGALAANNAYTTRATQRHNPTCFDCPTPPAMRICEYVERMRMYMGSSEQCFVIACVLITRLEDALGCMMVRPSALHRLLLAAVVVASKVHEDLCPDNKHFAAVGGVDLKLMNVLESTLAKSISFSAFVTKEEYIACIASINRIYSNLKIQHNGLHGCLPGEESCAAAAAAPPCASISPNTPPNIPRHTTRSTSPRMRVSDSPPDFAKGTRPHTLPLRDPPTFDLAGSLPLSHSHSQHNHSHTQHKRPYTHSSGPVSYIPLRVTRRGPNVDQTWRHLPPTGCAS